MKYSRVSLYAFEQIQIKPNYTNECLGQFSNGTPVLGAWLTIMALVLGGVAGGHGRIRHVYCRPSRLFCRRNV